MAVFEQIGIVAVGAACVVGAYRLAQSTGKYSSEASAMIGAGGGIAAFAVMAWLFAT